MVMLIISIQVKSFIVQMERGKFLVSSQISRYCISIYYLALQELIMIDIEHFLESRKRMLKEDKWHTKSMQEDSGRMKKKKNINLSDSSGFSTT